MIARFIPLLETLKTYRSDDARHDLIAGIILAVLTVPQAVAYAMLAGLPPESGLYACLAPLILYAFLGSARELVVGPVALTALMLATVAQEFAEPGSAEYVTVASTLAAQTGLFLTILALFRVGGIVNLLSTPVISGFVNGAALLIIFSQLKTVLGLDLQPTGIFDELPALFSAAPDSNIAALSFAAGTATVLFFFRRLLIPLLAAIGVQLSLPWHRMGPMIVTMAAMALVITLGYDGSDLPLVGALPAGLPSLSLPSTHWRLWLDLAPSAGIIALVVFISSYSVAFTLAARSGRRVRPTQELFALGLANLSAAFSATYPVAGSFSRSSVGYAAGARTQISNLICAAMVVFTLLFFTAWFAYLPNAVLAVIIIVSVLGMIEIDVLREQWRFMRRDALLSITTTFSVLLVGLETGLVIGVFISFAVLLQRSARPHIAVVGRLQDTGAFRNVLRHKTQQLPHLLAVRIDEGINFTNVRYIERFILTQLEAHKGKAHHESLSDLLLVCTAVNHIDSSGLQMLMRLCRELQTSGLRVSLSEVKGPIMDRLEYSSLPDLLERRIYFTTDEAFQALA